MFAWLTQRREMIGGLRFGPPAWLPERIEDEGHKSGEARGETPATLQMPQGRKDLAALLEKFGWGRTSAVTPGLLEQMHELGDRRIRAIVLNLLPTQPEFALSAGLTRAALPEILTGLRMIQTAVQARRVMVVADRFDWRSRKSWYLASRIVKKAKKRGFNTKWFLKQYPQTDPMLLEKLAGKVRVDWAFDVKGIPNQYPVAHPTLLLRRLFGKRLHVGHLPVRANRMIVDPVTCWALGRWLSTGKRLTHRPVQLFEQGLKNGTARLVMGTIGETIEKLCQRYGLATADRQVIVNGMLAGEQVEPAAARVETWTESVSVREVPKAETATECFACGWCVDVCPTGLNPVSLLDLVQKAQRAGGIETKAGASHLKSGLARESRHCVGCGLCSFVCPTRLPLTQQTLRLRGWVEASGHAD